MQQQESDTSKDTVFINIRKLAALDIVWHGPKLSCRISLTVGLGCTLAGFSFSFFIRTSTHPLYSLS